MFLVERILTIRGGGKKNILGNHQGSIDVSEDFPSRECISIFDLDENDSNSLATPLKDIDFSGATDNSPKEFYDYNGHHVFISGDENTGEITALKKLHLDDHDEQFNENFPGHLASNYPEINAELSAFKDDFVLEFNNRVTDFLLEQAEKETEIGVKDIIVNPGDSTETKNDFIFDIKTTYFPGENGDFGGANFEDLVHSGERVFSNSEISYYYVPGLEDFMWDEVEQRVQQLGLDEEEDDDEFDF